MLTVVRELKGFQSYYCGFSLSEKWKMEKSKVGMSFEKCRKVGGKLAWGQTY